MPARANSKNPNRPTPASLAASDTNTLTGLPVSARSAPAWAPNASGISNCEDGKRTRMAITTTTGTRAATAPLTLMRAVTSAHTTITRPTTRDPRVAGPLHELLSDPRRHPGGVEGLAHHEQRGDVDDGRVTEPAERFVEVEHSGGPERQRDREGDDRDGDPVPHEQDHRSAEDQERDGALGHQPRWPIRGQPTAGAADVVQSESTAARRRRGPGHRRRTDPPRSRPRRRPTALPRSPGRTRPPAPRRRGRRARPCDGSRWLVGPRRSCVLHVRSWPGSPAPSGCPAGTRPRRRSAT